jgi:hypothetical protein
MVAQWLRYCTTNRKVAGSISDGVIGIFHWHNPSDRSMALGSTQPLTEMSTRSISWGVKAVVAWGWQPYHHPVLLSCNLGTLTSWNPLGRSRPVTGLLYLNFLEPSGPLQACNRTALPLYSDLYPKSVTVYLIKPLHLLLKFLGPTCIRLPHRGMHVSNSLTCRFKAYYAFRQCRN